ncbi:PREDICTED: RNA pseudouridine synthase 3, mitochondrial [Tarenaya hassleriana]|uniref:RNA pseudouridine synthase 3, mitochondrial n=1 Tax=Tarenaya hassleriana TaxID=28532 RepID=UPI00053C3359|nr:PREDICTED: RNA pseudouridine synthase 3, mitochondrial [Tarenaya hassleriana]
MWKTKQRFNFSGFRHVYLFSGSRWFSRIAPPPPAVIRVKNNVAHLGPPKEGPLPRQLMSLPPFPGLPLPGRNAGDDGGGRERYVTAISWLKYYLDEIHDKAIQSHFNKGLVRMESSRGLRDSWRQEEEDQSRPMRMIKLNEVMRIGDRIWLPVSVAETRINKRYDTIPSGTLYPNADEIKYLQRLVRYKDSAIIVLNKPPKLPVKGHVAVHNSMDALAAAALSYGNDEGPKLVHRLDRESSGLIVMGRTQQSIDTLHWLFSDLKGSKSSYKEWNDACEAMYQKYWALVIGSPKEKEGIISAPLSKVVLDDGKTERIVLAQCSGLEASHEALTEYRVLGPMINGCSWIELRPITSRKHQLRVHCAEALGTPIVGDYKYGWFVHKRWKQMPRVDIEPTSGKPYKMRRPSGLDVQKGSVLSKVPLLHLHCREMVIPNIDKFLHVWNRQGSETLPSGINSKPDLLRFVASMPNHMKISWNLMSSYLV